MIGRIVIIRHDPVTGDKVAHGPFPTMGEARSWAAHNYVEHHKEFIPFA